MVADSSSAKSHAQAAIYGLLPRLYQLRDLAELPLAMLEAVSAIIPNVFATYNRIDLRTGAVTAAYFPGHWQPRMEAIMPLIHPHMQSHPIYRHVFETGDGTAHFTADFVGEEEWRETPFARVLAQLGVQECLIFCLQTSRQELIFIALNRAARTFTESERELANALRPHFITAHENAVAFTEVQAQVLLSTQAIEQTSHGLMLIDSTAHVLHMSLFASELLTRFFPHSTTWKSALPPEILHWLERNAVAPRLPAEPLQIARDGAMLTVRVAASDAGSRILHLREATTQSPPDHWRAFGLTPREAEVLQWVAEGKSNPEIGGILDISHRTVAKHLQVIFEKLGVEGRVPALLRARGF